MQELCHRCGGELVSGDSTSSFCPHCGAPQIYLSEAAAPDAIDASNSTGVLPPPHPQLVEWRTAVLCAGLVALVAAILSILSTKVPALSFLSWLWTVSASVIALGIYQRRKPQAQMDASVGARIGIVVGLGLIVSIGMTMVVAGLVARFGLHAMGTFDAELRAQIDKAASANPQPAEVMRYIYSPEFKAGIMLAGLVMVLSTIGGAVSGLLRTRRS
jgi:hypothetical protein